MSGQQLLLLMLLQAIDQGTASAQKAAAENKSKAGDAVEQVGGSGREKRTAVAVDQARISMDQGGVAWRRSAELAGRPCCKGERSGPKGWRCAGHDLLENAHFVSTSVVYKGHGTPPNSPPTT